MTIRWGLCCLFKHEPIRFRRTTAAFMAGKSRREQLDHLAILIRYNAESLMKALVFCHENGIGDFRINSQILPLKTHPDCGYEFSELPDHQSISDRFFSCRHYGLEHHIRMSLHPDQFTLLSSPTVAINEKSVHELNYQAEFASFVNADVITIHGGGGYGDKQSALKRLRQHIDLLDDAVRSRLTLENDDRVYTPNDLLPVCHDMQIPLVYDIHHHRCLPDGSGEEETTEKALETWNREPLFHLSSPDGSWDTKKTRHHADFIEPSDFPDFWRAFDITVEVEAKAKEEAVIRMIQTFRN